MQQQHIVLEVITDNRVINACQKGGNWQLAVELLQELREAGLQPGDITYGIVIDALHVANKYDKAEQLYLEMQERGLVLSHWSTRDKGKLDFHDFTEGMAAAAMKIVLCDIVLCRATARKSNSSDSNSASYVHPIHYDLHIITGQAMHRQHKDGSVLQPLIMNMLKQLNIECSINKRNTGMVTVKSSALQEYAARVNTTQQQ
jgi:pentatricopeptide repeat protein